MSFEDSPVDREWNPTQKEWEKMYPPHGTIMDISTARDRLDLRENWYRCCSQRKADRIAFAAAVGTACGIAMGATIAAGFLWR